MLVTVNVLLETPTLCTVPVPPEVLIETFPLAPLSVMPDPAFNRVTPVLVTLMFPFAVIGPPATVIPSPAVRLTLVTVPPAVPFAIEVILPYVSTVTFA